MATAQAQTTIPSGTWKSDPVHSSVGFSVKYAGVGTFRGAFGRHEATLGATDGEPRLSGLARVESVEVRDENLYGHLLSPEFFDAERHPEISFVSREIRTDGDGIVVVGDLTIKGETSSVEARGSISAPVEHMSGGQRIGLDLEATVDRTEFGMNWNAELPAGGFALADEVTLRIHLVLRKDE